MRYPSFLAAGVCPVLVAAAILMCGAVQCLAQETDKTGTSKEERIVVRGEVVEVTGDKVRVAIKDKAEPQVGDAVKISLEIVGTDIKADVAQGKVAKVEPGFATVDITNKTAQTRQGYLVEITSTRTAPAVAGEKKSPDLSGRWESFSEKHKAVWVLKRRGDDRYDAEQNEPGLHSTGCRAVAEFSNGKLQIRWAANGFKGFFEWQIDATHTKAKGKHEIDTPQGLKTFHVTITRISNEADKRGERNDVPKERVKTLSPNDLSGRWREDTGANAPVWTLMRQADGKYQVRQAVFGHPSTGCEGTAEFAKGTLTIQWVQDKVKNKGGGEWKIDGTQTKAYARHFIFSFTGRNDRDYGCTVTRLTDHPATELESKDSANEKNK